MNLLEKIFLCTDPSFLFWIISRPKKKLICEVDPERFDSSLTVKILTFLDVSTDCQISNPDFGFVYQDFMLRHSLPNQLVFKVTQYLICIYLNLGKNSVFVREHYSANIILKTNEHNKQAREEI